MEQKEKVIKGVDTMRIGSVERKRKLEELLLESIENQVKGLTCEHNKVSETALALIELWKIC